MIRPKHYLWAGGWMPIRPRGAAQQHPKRGEGLWCMEQVLPGGGVCYGLGLPECTSPGDTSSVAPPPPKKKASDAHVLLLCNRPHEFVSPLRAVKRAPRRVLSVASFPPPQIEDQRARGRYAVFEKVSLRLASAGPNCWVADNPWRCRGHRACPLGPLCVPPPPPPPVRPPPQPPGGGGRPPPG